MAGRRPRGFVGPKTYNPQLAQATAAASAISHEELLRQQLGLPDDSDASDSGSVSGASVDSGAGRGPSQAELQELREQLAEAQQAAEAAEKKAAADIKAMQWRMRTSLLASKKATQAKSELIAEMIDALYELEKQVEERGGTLETVWSEYYEEKNESGGAGSSPMKQPSGRGVDNPESKSDAGGVGGADMLEVLALKKQVKQLKDEVAAAREKVAKGEARQTKLTAKLDEARRSLANGGGGAANGASGGGASSEELADALDAAQAAQADAKKLGKKLANTEEERATAVRELKAAKSSAADLQRHVDSLTAQLQSVSSGGDAAAAASAAAGQQVDALKAEREALERRVQALEEEVSAARDAADEAAAGQAKAEKALGKAQARLSAAQAQVAEVQQQAKTAVGEVETLRARNAELDAKQKQMTETMSAAAGEAEAVLQKQLDETRGELETARAETKEAQDANNANIEAAQQALATWKEKYTALKADRKQLKHQLQQAAAELQKLDESVAESTARAADLESKLQVATTELAQRTKDANSAAGSASKLEARIEELTTEVAASKERIAALTRSSTEAQTKADTASKRAAEAEAQIEDMHKQHEEERQQIIDILKTKYTKRIEKWKARASSSQAILSSHRQFRSGMRETLSAFRREVATDFGDLNAIIESKCHKLSRAAKAQSKHLGTVLEKYRKESKMRKRLHNDLMELRGNIRVFARVRPVVPKEDAEGAVVVAKFPSEGVISLVNSKRLQKEWEFDHVFRPEHTNTDVFEQCKDLLTSVVDGYNVCIFAYGQTGAGKTHTMGGSDDNPGLNFRTLNLLFELSEERSEMWHFDISMSLLEIYNETIADLLSTDQLSSKLTVKRGEHGNYVPGLTEVPVHSCEQVLDLMRRGYETRTTFATNSNEHSSRSHCILSVHVLARNKHTNMVARGKLHLVDLAGSERVGKSGATGARLKEAQAINKSLSALGNVIASRAAKNSHTPFRDSILTYLLEDSLSKQSKTLMFVNMSPVSTNADESFCSLNFAARVRTVELGRASKNVSGSDRPSSRNSRPSSRNSRK